MCGIWHMHTHTCTHTQEAQMWAPWQAQSHTFQYKHIHDQKFGSFILSWGIPLFPFFFSCYWQALAGIISIWMLSSKPMIYVVRQQRCKLSIVTIIENDNAFDVLSLYHLADFGEWNARAWPTVVRAGVKGIWVGWGKEFVEYDCSRVFTTVDTLLPSLNNLWALL